MLNEILLFSTLCAALLSLVFSLVLSKRLDIAERRRRYEIECLIQKLQHQQQQTSETHENLRLLGETAYQLAHEIEHNRKAKAAQLTEKTTRTEPDEPADPQRPPAPSSRILH